MTTRNYPQEIESAALEAAKWAERLSDIRATLEEMTDQITCEVLKATDETTGKPLHPNDMARQLAIREVQRGSDEYQEWKEKEGRAEYEKAAASARLERLRGEFSEFKLQRRERIAAIDAAIN